MSPRRLPNATEASVEEGKLKKYLLSETHPKGKAKARFFRPGGSGWPV